MEFNSKILIPRFDPKAMNDCQYLIQKAMSFNNVAIAQLNNLIIEFILFI